MTYKIFRPFESHSSSATANQKPFQFAEGVNLQSGWDSADEDGTGDVFEPPPLPSKNGQTKIVNTLIAENVKNSALLGQTVVTDLNEKYANFICSNYFHINGTLKFISILILIKKFSYER